VLRCVDTLDGAPCTHAALLDLRAGTRTGVGQEREVGMALERLLLDHEGPLHATSHRWRAAMRAAPRSWDDGPDGAALCHDLFGVGFSESHGAACVRFRCGLPRDAEGVARYRLWTTRTVPSVVAVWYSGGSCIAKLCAPVCASTVWFFLECWVSEIEPQPSYHWDALQSILTQRTLSLRS